MTETEEKGFLESVSGDRSRRMNAIMNWVYASLFHWKVPHKKIPTDAIKFDWSEDPRLKHWVKTAVLELDCANYSGNLSELGYAFTLEQLEAEFESGRPFQLPPERFHRMSKAALSLERVPGEMSYLPGVFYEKSTNRLYGTGPVLDVKDRYERRLRFFLEQPNTWAPNLLVRFDYSGGLLNMLLMRPESKLNVILRREDILSHMARTYMADDGVHTELYLLLKMRATELNGYFNRDEWTRAEEKWQTVANAS